MGGVFISYRRDDSRGTAGRLYDALSDRFGRDRVFRDLDAIQPGAVYGEVIDGAIAGCSALVVVIGTNWLTQDPAGRRRLDSATDLVRTEIASALAQNKVVVPVLVEDATMPSEADLPADLASLAQRNALPLSDQRWDYDVSRLLTLLDPLLGPARAEDRAAPSGRRPRARPTIGRGARWGIPILVLVLLGAVAVVASLSQKGSEGEQHPGQTSVATLVDAGSASQPTSDGSPGSTAPAGAIPISIGDTVAKDKPAGAGEIAAPGVRQRYRFSGTAGQLIYLKEVWEGPCCDLRWELLAPSGSKIDGNYMDTDIGRVTLNTTGTHKIEVFGNGSGTGTYGFTLTAVP